MAESACPVIITVSGCNSNLKKIYKCVGQKGVIKAMLLIIAG
jgi:hypothetical protein